MSKGRSCSCSFFFWDFPDQKKTQQLSETSAGYSKNYSSSVKQSNHSVLASDFLSKTISILVVLRRVVTVYVHPVLHSHIHSYASGFSFGHFRTVQM